MKVYIVTVDYGYDHNDFEAVFSSQEKAEEYVQNYNKAVGGDIASWDEVEVDNP